MTSESIYGTRPAIEELPELREGEVVNLEFSGPETHGLYVSVTGDVIDILEDGFVVDGNRFEDKDLRVKACDEEGERRVHVQVVYSDSEEWEKMRTINVRMWDPDQVNIDLRRRTRSRASEDGNGITEQAKDVYKKAQESPEEVNVDVIEWFLSNPGAPVPAHASAVSALTRLVIEREDIDGVRFVDQLEAILGRPSLKNVVVLRCLRHIASENPGSVAGLRPEIISCIDTEDDEVTRAATGCCVELAQENPELLLEDVPLFGSLLHSEDETVRRNSVYVLTRVSEEHPEEVLPAVQDVIDNLKDQNRDPNGSKSNLIGRVSRHYPDATVGAVPALHQLLHEDISPKTTANAVGALADIAKQYPEDVVEDGCVESVSELLGNDDETVRYNACGMLEEVSKGDPEAIQTVVPELLERLEDGDEGVRIKTAYTLGEIREEKALGRLEELEKEDTSERVREIAGMAVVRIK
jgi:hypothetical protein